MGNITWSELIQLLGLFLGCSGFWEIVKYRFQNRSAQSRALRGILHDRICYLGEQYIKRGSVTKDEYETLVDEMYDPYKKMGGNGTAKKIIAEVEKLPIK